MPAVTGVFFKWPLIRQIRGRGYATIPLTGKDQPKYPSTRNRSFFLLPRNGTVAWITARSDRAVT
jgi:hypothetical protein